MVLLGSSKTNCLSRYNLVSITSDNQGTTYCFHKPSGQSLRILERPPRAACREQRDFFLEFLVVRAGRAHQYTGVTGDHDQTLSLLDGVATEEPRELLGCFGGLGCTTNRMSCRMLCNEEVAKLQDALISLSQNGRPIDIKLARRW